jgi:hypothetical protein
MPRNKKSGKRGSIWNTNREDRLRIKIEELEIREGVK